MSQTDSKENLSGAEVSAEEVSVDAFSVEEIVELVARLSPAQRRTLYRRLRLSGLMDTEALKSDQRRLQVAPALSMGQRDPRGERPRAESSKANISPAPARSEEPEAYHSPVSGRVVVGSPPAEPARDDDPHATHPLPGRGPEQPIRIVFDGGSRGNPGQGYGSYALDWPGTPQQVIRLQFGDRVTNNEAEYDTLIAALEGVIKRLQDQGADPKTVIVEIRGDSQLVINQVRGQWKCNQERMRVRRDRVRELLQQFARWKLTHHARKHSVDVLGH